MLYQVSLNDGVDFAPQSEAEEILQNVKTILSTRLGSVPLFRDFGITWEHIDKPLPVAKSLMLAAVIDAVEEFEPRAKVRSVEFEEDTDNAAEGILKPKVIISIGEEE